MTGLLTITAEPLTPRMAGPAIRAVELTRAVARVMPARVVSLAGCEWDDPTLQVGAASGDTLKRLVADAQCVLVQGDVLGLEPWLIDSAVPLIVDVYDPFHLEQLEQSRSVGEANRRVIVRDCVRALNRQLARADFVLAASARQRDLWLGHLAALGRVNPPIYDQRHDLGGLLAVVPFGVSAEPPPQAGRSIRGLFPDIDDDSVVALWSGGIYDWFDPELVVRAIALARRTEPRLQLIMMGASHPVLNRRPAAETRVRELTDQLGLAGHGVHFADGWIPYEERTYWLQSADIGVLAHHPGIEAEFAFRTRLLDHLWTGLPTVGTSGDLLTDLISDAGAGIGVPVGDVKAFAAALLELAGSADRRSRASKAAELMAETYHWDQVARPLLEFCRAPHRAPDLALSRSERSLLVVEPPRLRDRLVAGWQEGGPRLLATRLLRRLRP